MFKLKKRNKICRLYFEDIFGTVLVKKKPNKISFFLMQLQKRREYKPFVFRFVSEQKEIHKPRMSRHKKLFSFRKKLSYFYGGFRKKTYKHFAVQSSKGGHFFQNFILSFELTLSSIVFRMNVCNSMKEAMRMVVEGKVLLNNEVIKQPRHCVGLGDIVQIIPSERFFYYRNFVLNLKQKHRVSIFDTHYLAINHEILSALVFRLPMPGLIPYPFSLSSSKVVGEFLEKE